MKLNRVWIVAAAAAMVAGSVAVAGCTRADDEGSDDAQVAATEQESVSGDQADQNAELGVTEYARGGGAHGGGAHGGGARGGHGGFGHGGFGHGRGGWGHGGWGHRGWGWGHGWRHGARWWW